jgi:hypothetical protein
LRPNPCAFEPWRLCVKHLSWFIAVGNFFNARAQSREASARQAATKALGLN